MHFRLTESLDLIQWLIVYQWNDTPFISIEVKHKMQKSRQYSRFRQKYEFLFESLTHGFSELVFAVALVVSFLWKTCSFEVDTRSKLKTSSAFIEFNISFDRPYRHLAAHEKIGKPKIVISCYEVGNSTSKWNFASLASLLHLAATSPLTLEVWFGLRSTDFKLFINIEFC